MKKSICIKTSLFFLAFCFLVIGESAGVEDMKSPIYESRPKDLIIYEGNVAYAKDTLKIYPQDLVRVLLPSTIITRTVNIVDGKEKIGSFNFISLESATSSPESRLISSRQQGNFPVLQWRSKALSPQNVFLSYLLSGISWSPSYALNILADNKVLLRYNVAITNTVLSLSEVNVRLVSGMVGRIQEAEQAYRRSMTEAQRAYSDFERPAEIAALPTVGAMRINAYYTYDLGQIRNLEKGMNYVTLLDQELDAEKEFVWVTSAGERVDVIYTVQNSTKQPFAAGLVEAYQDGIYMGSDAIEWTPSGSKGHVTIGGAVDIQVKKTVNITKIPERRQTDEFHHEVELKTDNFSQKDIKLKIIDFKYPDCVDISFSLKPTEEEAQTYMWQIELKAGDSRIIKYDFYSDRAYYEPYRVYR